MLFRSIFVTLFVVLNSSFLILNSFSQWEPDVRLTNASGISQPASNNAWSIGVNENVVHSVWSDNRDGIVPEIYYKRSTDSGINWGSDIRLTFNALYSYYPSIAVSGSFVHVVWEDGRDGNIEVYYKRSTDGGINWGPDTRLTNNDSSSVTSSITVSGTTVHLVWSDDRDGNFEIYYKRSSDGGLNWSLDTRLTNAISFSKYPSIAVSGLVVHLAWQDNRIGGDKIYYKRSTDGGINWGTDTCITNNTYSNTYPSIAVSGSLVHVVWQDARALNADIYYRRSSDNGLNWGAENSLTTDSNHSYLPSIATSNTLVHVVWYDYRDGNGEIYYKRSTDGGINWGLDTRLTNNTSESRFPSIAVSGPLTHIIWSDNRDAYPNYEIYYKRNPTGNTVGIQNIYSEVPTAFSLEQNYPNPFNPITKVRFNISGFRFVKLVVFDILGKEVATLVNESLQPGTYEVTFDAASLSSGVYFYKITAGDFSAIRKMVLVR